MLVQLNTVKVLKHLQVQSPFECGPDRVDLESVLGVCERLGWGYLVDAGQPGEHRLGAAAFDGETDVLDLVAFRAQGDKAIEALDHLVVVVEPHFVALDWVFVAVATAQLAFVAGGLEDDRLQSIPGSRGDIRSHIAVPACCRNELDGQTYRHFLTN